MELYCWLYNADLDKCATIYQESVVEYFTKYINLVLQKPPYINIREVRRDCLDNELLTPDEIEQVSDAFDTVLFWGGHAVMFSSCVQFSDLYKELFIVTEKEKVTKVKE